MIKSFINTTDNFLCNNVKSIFEKTEDGFKLKNRKVDIVQELKNFEYDPLISIMGESTKFEHSIKFKVKIMLGIFFVFLPLLGFIFITYLLDVEYTYAFVVTFIVAMLASTRMDTIASRYSQKRYASL